MTRMTLVFLANVVDQERLREGDGRVFVETSYMDAIALAAALSVRTVERSLTALELAGHVFRDEPSADRLACRVYDLSPLVAKFARFKAVAQARCDLAALERDLFCEDPRHFPQIVS